VGTSVGTCAICYWRNFIPGEQENRRNRRTGEQENRRIGDQENRRTGELENRRTGEQEKKGEQKNMISGE